MKLSIFLAAALLLNTPAVQASTSPGVFVPVKPNGLMVNVPNVGPSRVESLNYCIKDVGVDKYQDLITDSDFVNFERCMLDLT